MGEYFQVANLTKREYINPHPLGVGAKLPEQVRGNAPGTGSALLLLCALLRFDMKDVDTAELTSDEIRERENYYAVLGRWTGDQIAVVGCDGKRSILPDGDLLYLCCQSTDEDFKKVLDELIADSKFDDAVKMTKIGRFTDITPLVATVLEVYCDGKLTGTGWKKWVPNVP